MLGPSSSLRPFIVCVGATLLFLLFRWVLLRWLKLYGARIDSVLPDDAVRILRGPSFFWCVAIAVRVGIQVSTLPPQYKDPLHDLVQVLILISGTLAGANLLEAALQHVLTRAGSPLSHSGIISGAVRIVAAVVGGLLILARLGVHIGPLLTALGVGGLAVGLALQDTLGNLFAGLGLLLDRAIQVGDQLKLDGGWEGRLEDIGWRSSKLRTSSDELIVIPNTKLAQNVAIRKKTA